MDVGSGRIIALCDSLSKDVILTAVNVQLEICGYYDLLGQHVCY